jgi:hypothetical protein
VLEGQGVGLAVMMTPDQAAATNQLLAPRAFQYVPAGWVAGEGEPGPGEDAGPGAAAAAAGEEPDAQAASGEQQGAAGAKRSTRGSRP